MLSHVINTYTLLPATEDQLKDVAPIVFLGWVVVDRSPEVGDNLHRNQDLSGNSSNYED